MGETAYLGRVVIWSLLILVMLPEFVYPQVLSRSPEALTRQAAGICWDFLGGSEAIPCCAAACLDVIPVGPVEGIAAVVLRIEARRVWSGNGIRAAAV